MTRQRRRALNLDPGPFMTWLARRADPSLPTGLYLTLGLAGVVVFAAGFASIAEDLLESATLLVDRAVQAAMGGVATPLFDRVMWGATVLGDTAVAATVSVAAVLLFALWGRPRRAVVLAAMMIVAPVLDAVLKGMFERPRPPQALALIATPQSYSFPSGHALSSIVLYGGLALILLLSSRPAWQKAAGAAVAVVPGTLVGLSRIYLGVHYASDVLASWLLGASVLSAGMAALLAWERFGAPRAASHFPGGALRWRLGVSTVLLAAPVVAFVLDAATVTLR
jgi:undecaprenyl-diphosphatase